jgi:hypothetical protein
MPGSRFVPSEEGIARLQAQVNAAGQDVVRKVHAEKAGCPVLEVMAALRAGMRAIGMQPNDNGLMPAAEAISAGKPIE